MVHQREDSPNTSAGRRRRSAFHRFDDVDDRAVDDPVRMVLGVPGVGQVLRADLLDVAGDAVEPKVKTESMSPVSHRPRGAVDVAGLGQWAQGVVHGTDGNAWATLR